MENITQHHGEFVFYPTNRVIGIIDSPDNAQAAVELFREKGYEDAKMDVLVGAEAAKLFDVDGSKHGILTKLARTIQKFADNEIETLKKHVSELEAGHVFFAVETDGSEAQIKEVSDILAGNLAHDVYFFGNGAIRQLSAQG